MFSIWTEVTHYLPYLGLAYLLTVNIVGAAVVLSDKRRARKREWRTPERVFKRLAMLGGGIGVLLGFLAFRHKTRHAGLVLGVVAATLLFYALITVGLFLLW